MLDGLMMPVIVLTKRFFLQGRDDQDEHSKVKRYVKYKYVKVTHDKQLTYSEGKMRVGVFKKISAKISEQEYNDKLLTLKALYGNKDGEIYNNDAYEWTYSG